MFGFSKIKKNKVKNISVPKKIDDIEDEYIDDVKCKSYIANSNIDKSYVEDLHYVSVFMGISGSHAPIIEDTTNINSNYIYLSGEIKKCKDLSYTSEVNSFDELEDEDEDEEEELNMINKKKPKLNIKVV